MEQPPLPQLDPLQVTLENGALRSAVHGDLFFSGEDGLAESRHVFIGGTDLATALLHRDHLVIAETGFGTGLNLLAVCALVKELNSRCRIDYISFESAPLTPQLVAAAHSPFAEIGPLSEELRDQWPRRWHGVHCLSMCRGQLCVQLHFGQAADIMASLDFCADIWFLDGFAPAKNPELWSADLCCHIARLSAPSARLATFTVARMVRDNLADAGFAVEKRLGFGRKREMLAARLETRGLASTRIAAPRHVAVIGSGIAGAAIGNVLSNCGISHTIVEKQTQLAPAASGNLQGLLVPFLSVGDMPAARLSISALAHSRAYADRHGLVLSSGVISLDFSVRKTRRQSHIAAQEFPFDLAHYLTAAQVAERCGIHTGMGGLCHEAAAVISPVDMCRSLLGTSPVLYGAELAGISGDEGDWQLDITNGGTLSASHIIYCSGADLHCSAGADKLAAGRLQITSGQLSYLPASTGFSGLKTALNYSGYILPCYDGRQIIGAGFDHDATQDVTLAGHLQNLELLPQSLRPLAGAADSWQGRRSRRLATPDRLPLAGPISPTRYVLSALGARGLTLAGLLAESLGRRLQGRPDILDQRLKAALSPERLIF